MLFHKMCTRVLLAATVVIATCFVLADAVQAGKVQLPAGTGVKVRFDAGARISSGHSAVGVPLLIYLDQPITVGGKVIVEAEARGTAVISEVKRSRRGGKPGKIAVEFVDLETKGEFKTSNGERIKLSGRMEREGKGKKTLSYLFIFGLFIKGGDGEIATGQVYTATIAENIILESK